jgi:hypothetical protein
MSSFSFTCEVVVAAKRKIAGPLVDLLQAARRKGPIEVCPETQGLGVATLPEFRAQGTLFRILIF